MKYIHQSTYGHAGGLHTARPIFAMKDNHIYDMVGGRPSTNPVYKVAGSKVFATEHHPGGATPHAVYEIRGDKIHTTEHHPEHNPTSHTFEIR